MSTATVTPRAAPRYSMCRGDVAFPLVTSYQVAERPRREANVSGIPSLCSRFQATRLVSLVVASFLLRGDGLPGPNIQ